MPLRLEIKKELSNRSDRVKSVDIHSSADNPWVLSALYNGNVYIWDYSNNVSVFMSASLSSFFLLKSLVDVFHAFYALWESLSAIAPSYLLTSIPLFFSYSAHRHY